MKKFYLFLIITSSTIISATKTNGQTTSTSKIGINGKLFTAAYQQQAAEYKALCFQAYNLATLRLNEALALNNSGRPLAVITDIDETALDNSPYSVHQGLQDKDYEISSWADWTSRSAADTLAGALQFFKYAASKNVEVFYITNREEKERAGTLANLQKFDFPYADDKHLIPKTTTSSKEQRRQQVATTHDIVLLLGDNLGDFSSLFDKKTSAERIQNVQNHAADFGKKFIVLPNPNYGDWEGALYKYNYKMTPAQKDSVIKATLKNY